MSKLVNAGKVVQSNQVDRSIIGRKLPMFSGNPEEWHYFRICFEKSTAEWEISDEENLIRLRDSLKGPALDHVRGLIIHPALVPKTMSVLQQQFGDPVILCLWLVQKIKKMENPNRKNISASAQFARALFHLCCLLDTLNCDQENQINRCVIELLHKLTPEMIGEWNKRSNPQPMRNFCEFVVEFFADVSTLYYETLSNSLLSESKQPQRKEMCSTKQDKQEKGTNTNKITCPMCNSFDHPLWHCREFKQLNLKNRTFMVRVWKLCNICFGDHSREDCNSKIRCNVGSCRAKHNGMLHVNPLGQFEIGDDIDLI